MVRVDALQSDPQMTPGTETARGRQSATFDVAGSIRQLRRRCTRRELALWALVAATLLGDVATTLGGLRLGLAESNPLVAGALALGGVAGFLGVKAAVLGVAVALRAAYPAYRVAVPLGLALPWALAASANVALIAAQL